MNTKERILDAALTLFAEKGYGSVSVAEIAEAVGIRAPSLYKHYPSKRSIFEAIMERMSAGYADAASGLGMDGSDPDSDAVMFSGITEASLEEMVKGLFGYFLHDPYAGRFRRMLTIEQFRDPEAAKLLSEQLFDGPVRYQTSVFGKLLAAGILAGDDPESMAIEFYSPIAVLLSVCDRQPDREADCMRILERHVRDFERVHRAIR